MLCCTLGDLVGKLLAYASLTPIIIVVSFLTLIFFKRDIHTVFSCFYVLWFITVTVDILFYWNSLE